MGRLRSACGLAATACDAWMELWMRHRVYTYKKIDTNSNGELHATLSHWKHCIAELLLRAGLIHSVDDVSTVHVSPTLYPSAAIHNASNTERQWNVQQYSISTRAYFKYCQNRIALKVLWLQTLGSSFEAFNAQTSDLCGTYTCDACNEDFASYILWNSSTKCN